MMVLALRIMQGAVLLLACPMVALGVMSSLSGGGMTPAFQEIGGRMAALSFYPPIPVLIASEVIHRWLKLTPLSLVLLAALLVVWVGLLVWLQRETGFFTAW